jgi:hypothetical protein
VLLQKIIKDLHEAKAANEHLVLSAHAVEDFVGYKFLIGKINGLEIAINICQNILEEINNDRQ